VRRTRIAAALAVPVVLLAAGACRDSSTGTPPRAPDGSVQQQLDEMESTLDGIESELDGG
jgi:hypothetical protein